MLSNLVLILMIIQLVLLYSCCFVQASIAKFRSGLLTCCGKLDQLARRNFAD